MHVRTLLTVCQHEMPSISVICFTISLRIHKLRKIKEVGRGKKRRLKENSASRH
jgi:hypothetical protein